MGHKIIYISFGKVNCTVHTGITRLYVLLVGSGALRSSEPVKYHFHEN